MKRSRASLNRTVKGQDAFSLIEMMVVVLLIGILLGTALIAYFTAGQGTDLVTTVEMIKGDIRQAYALTNSGANSVTGPDGIIYRDRYKLVFNLAADSPANCYKFQRQSYSGGSYGAWTDYTDRAITANRIADSVYYRPGNSNEIRISSITGTNTATPKEIVFESRGSIVMTNAPGEITITVQSPGAGTSKVIKVGIYGSVE